MMKRIRIDWAELEDTFCDGSDEHRYYLDRDTGAVHFFSPIWTTRRRRKTNTR